MAAELLDHRRDEAKPGRRRHSEERGLSAGAGPLTTPTVT